VDKSKERSMSKQF